MHVESIFKFAPAATDSEVFEEIVRSGHVRIERILSPARTSPESGWYDQEENEWVVVLRGSGRLAFDDGTEVVLDAGDYIDLPAHTRHRVAWTDPDRVTVWLAVFYG